MIRIVLFFVVVAVLVLVWFAFGPRRAPLDTDSGQQYGNRTSRPQQPPRGPDDDPDFLRRL